MIPYLATALILLVYLILACLLGTWMRLAGAPLWIMRGGLALIGFVAAGAFLWFRRDSRAPAGSADGGDADEIDLLFRAADAKLSRTGGLGKTPVFVVTGMPGSAKTSVLLHSGLEPELLAGKAQQDGAVAPTRSVNLWWAAGAVFVEPAGSLVENTEAWARVVRRLVPDRLRSVVAGGSQAPRAALVCCDAETLFTAGPQAAAQARLLRARLGELAQALGAPLPAYALFTRMDRLPFFTDFVGSLSKPEAAAVLGCTLPLQQPAAGLYAEAQSERIARSFDELLASLSGARLEILGRESDDVQAGSAYEFPREFRKLRTAVSDYLVALGQPSRFAAGPLLRGFYFCGVRPVVVENPVARAVPVRQAAGVLSGATVIFRTDGGADAPAAPPLAARSVRKVPEWVFLERLLRDVVLADASARAASGASPRTGALRRGLLAGATALGLLLAAAFTVSWGRNRSLESDLLSATRALPADDLSRLDALRESLQSLSAYRAAGPPLSYRWGLYAGDRLYPEARRIYFERFRTALFSETQSRLAESLRALPAKPGPDYGTVYDTLKAYLITTSDHDKSSAFLAPVLLDRWSAGRAIDPDRRALAARQFAFYAEELKSANPYTSANDAFAIDRARDYLAQFAGLERIYRAMLAEAAKTGPPIEFNRLFAGSAAAVVDPYPVSAAFGKPGYEVMKTAIRNPGRYFSGEQWVLGDRQGARLDSAGLEDQLRARYAADFLEQWRGYLKSASVARYANLADAARKLNLLAGNQSPLLELFSLASENTAADDAGIASAFQPVQAVEPPGAGGRFVAPPNQSYMNALLALQSAVEQAAAQPAATADAAAAPVLAAAGNARIAARQIAQTFKPDPTGHVDAIVQKLMEDPIAQIESLLRVLGPEELNGKGRALCTQLAPLLKKYPFDANATAEAALSDVSAAFRRPDGALWAFYETNLQKIFLRQGSRYVANPEAAVRANPAFVDFLNRASVVADILTGGFTYTLQAIPSDGVQNLNLSLDGQALSYSAGASSSKQFTWQPATGREAKASVRFGNGPDLQWSNSQGPWAIFHFFDKAERWQPSGSGYAVEWTIRIGKDPVTLPDGKPLTVRYDLNMGSLPPLLEKGYLAHMGCVAQIAR